MVVEHFYSLNATPRTLAFKMGHPTGPIDVQIGLKLSAKPISTGRQSRREVNELVSQFNNSAEMRNSVDYVDGNLNKVINDEFQPWEICTFGLAFGGKMAIREDIWLTHFSDVADKFLCLFFNMKDVKYVMVRPIYFIDQLNEQESKWDQRFSLKPLLYAVLNATHVPPVFRICERPSEGYFSADFVNRIEQFTNRNIEFKVAGHFNKMESGLLR